MTPIYMRMAHKKL